MKLFIDDERLPVDVGWHTVRSSREAIDWVKSHGIPSYISFDHDLGDSDTSMVFIHWLIGHMLDNGVTKFDYYVHSQNPIGKANIEGLLDSFFSAFDEAELI